MIRIKNGQDWVLTGELLQDEKKLPITDIHHVFPSGLIIYNSYFGKIDVDDEPWLNALVRQGGALTIPAADQPKFLTKLATIANLPKTQFHEDLDWQKSNSPLKLFLLSILQFYQAKSFLLQ